MQTIAASPGSLRRQTLLEYLGIKDKKTLSIKELDRLIRIEAVLKKHSIDDETQVGILQSFEKKHGHGVDLGHRLLQFDEFLSKFNDRNDIVESVASLGYLSHEELETQAQETGDWVSVIKRNPEPKCQSS